MTLYEKKSIFEKEVVQLQIQLKTSTLNFFENSRQSLHIKWGASIFFFFSKTRNFLQKQFLIVTK